MMVRQIRADLAPEATMQKAIELIGESGFPRHEKIVEAERLLRAAVRQIGDVEDFQRRTARPMTVEDFARFVRALRLPAGSISPGALTDAVYAMEKGEG